MPTVKSSIPTTKYAVELPTELHSRIEQYAEQLEQEKRVPISKKYVLTEILTKFFTEMDGEIKK